MCQMEGSVNDHQLTIGHRKEQQVVLQIIEVREDMATSLCESHLMYLVNQIHLPDSTGIDMSPSKIPNANPMHFFMFITYAACVLCLLLTLAEPSPCLTSSSCSNPVICFPFFTLLLPAT